MSKTLIIWEEVPEDTKLYLIPNEVANQYKNYLEEAHDRFINRDDENDGMRFLNVALLSYGSDSGLTEDDPFLKHASIFHEYKVKTGNPITEERITTVYLSGFVL